MKNVMFRIALVAGFSMMIASATPEGLFEDSKASSNTIDISSGPQTEVSIWRRLRGGSDDDNDKEIENQNRVSIQTISGQVGNAGVFVSGLGAWVRIRVENEASLIVLDENELYRDFAKQYNVQGGIKGLWNHVTNMERDSDEMTEFRQVMQSLMSQAKSRVMISPNLMVSGASIGVGVNAFPFVTLLRVFDTNGSEVVVISTGAPSLDIFAGNANANPLSVRENQSDIRLVQ